MTEDKETARVLNNLARERMIKRLLVDILFDLSVCEIEGWNKREYVERLKNEIDNLAERFCK